MDKVVKELEELMRYYLAAGLIGEYIGLKVAVEVIRRKVVTANDQRRCN